ncbi:TAXI family TRAP transporter solute-binding subunit [Streptomyces buecherae]|uniref:TAXI family TRAP transporter solute-binding subunit n=2 Tax=Streptomyces buecherae TaxID=2763006 RepID=UPI0027E12968|nr:TAXI family TRAP transporter solute-binding subunit [Streptomyces buecherae]
MTNPDARGADRHPDLPARLDACVDPSAAGGPKPVLGNTFGAEGRAGPSRSGPGRRRLVRGGAGGAAALAAWALAGRPSEPGPVRRLRLATGPEGGPYNAFGRALAAAVAASGQRLEVVPVATAASVDNLRKLAAGEVELALTMADAAQDAARGRAPFVRPVPLTALARVYVNYTHLAVPAHGPVRSVDDLAGRRVATGATGSGLRTVAERLLHAAGLAGDRAVREARLGLGESARALRAGDVHALMWSGGAPTLTLEALARAMPLRLLPLDALGRELRTTYGAVYAPVTLPPGAYGLREPVRTVGVSNYLAARGDVPARVVRALLRVVFGRWRELLREVTAGARLEPRFAIATGVVPLHPGAVDYYRSVYG